MLILGPQRHASHESVASPASPAFHLYVLFTDPRATRIAVKTAEALARGLHARITILLAQVVPYPLPLAAPPVPVAFTEDVMARMAENAQVETELQIHLCRDRIETVRQVLEPHSLVIIGKQRRRWWPFGEGTLARILRKDGHQVVLAGASALSVNKSLTN